MVRQRDGRFVLNVAAEVSGSDFDERTVVYVYNDAASCVILVSVLSTEVEGDKKIATGWAESGAASSRQYLEASECGIECGDAIGENDQVFLKLAAY